jgi:photosystem II stability/assembly factor-like uncharacterized protein
MRRLLLVTAALLPGAAAVAQPSGWTAQSALRGDDGAVTGLWGQGPDDVWAVTDRGTILHTSNGGKVWTRFKLQAPSLNAVTRTPRGLLLLGPGVIYSSPDDGKSWAAARINGEPDLRAAWANGNDVVVVGERGTILRSGDGGETWYEVRSDTRATLRAAWGSGGVVYAAGDGGVILRSGDGGKSFAPAATGLDLALHGVWGTGPDDVFAVGADATLVRGAGGRWTRQTAFVGGATLSFNAVWGRAADDVYVVGAGGVVLHFDGKEWVQLRTGTPAELKAVWGSGDVVYAAGAVVLKKTAGPTAVADTSPSPSPSPATPAAPASPPTPAAAGWNTLEPPQGVVDVWVAGLKVVAVGDGISVSTDGGATFAAAAPPNLTLRAVWGTGDEVWAVGDRGRVLRSRDGGTSWAEEALGVNQTLRDVWGSDAANVFVAGDRGLILQTSDGGRSWRALATGVGADLHAVWGLDRERVFVAGAGGTVLATVNGGREWTRAKRTPTTATLRGIWGNGRDVWVAGDTILHSADGGRSWQSRATGGTRIVAHGVWGRGREVMLAGSAGGAGVVLRSTDGASWVGQSFPQVPLVSALAGDAASLYAAAGTVILHHGRRPLPGRAWTRIAVAEGVGLNRMWGTADDLYVVGDRGFIGRSTDRGRTWTKLESNATEDLSGVWGSGPADVYVVGKGGLVLHSTDRGKTWTRGSVGTRDDLNAVWGASADDVYAVGAGAALGGVFRSSDRGKTWRALMGGGRTFWGVWGSSASDVIVVGWDGASGVVLRSGDGGRTWPAFKIGTHPYLTGIWGTSPRDLWVVGFGVILSSQDGGATWRADERATGPGAGGFGGIWGGSPDDVYVTADGLVFHTADRGATWRSWRAPIARTGAVWGAGGDVWVLGDGEIAHSPGR